MKNNRTLSASYFLLFTLLILPLLISPGVVLSFDEVYLFPRLWWLYGAVLPAALLLLWQRWRRVPPQAQASQKILTSALAGWIGWLTLSVLVNSAGWPGLWGARDRADGVLMHGLYAVLLLCGWHWAVTFSEVNKDQDRRWEHSLSLLILVTGGLTALSGVLQQLHLLGVPGEGAWLGISATPSGGTLGNRGYMGGAMALLLPLGLWSLGQSAARMRPYAIFANALMVWALLGALSRGAWVAGAIAVTVWAWQSRHALPQGWKTSLLVGIACFSLSLSVFDNGRSFGEGESSILGGSGRTVLWNSALAGIQQKPLFGWETPALYRAMHTRSAAELFAESGTKGNRLTDFLNTSPESAPSFHFRDEKGKFDTFTLGIDKVHNEYLDYALNYGLPAALFFIALLLYAIWNSLWSAPGLAAALVGYALYLMTWPEVIRFAPIAWFILGLALAQRLHPAPHQHHQT